ncbi:hypothetical protein SOMG_04925 [Schizosaccharomyces osmophilus]|uniref:Uncharacterized protein n=1 Tax=Schizosaccharomyces osmophilus TaxID=2545709 RepID=A0AAE9WKG7_9SCHI|nr:uncharacterized protein SOMG_04925 [Schizosaccharomyces osmophilus]WBW75582.1 hypothetical protein SOMG_04925 [Schizosaccharomyces osmophilus]
MPVTYQEALVKINDNWGRIKLWLKVLMGLIALDFALLAYMYENTTTVRANHMWTILNGLSVCISIYVIYLFQVPTPTGW